jgi:hypothetical protein
MLVSDPINKRFDGTTNLDTIRLVHSHHAVKSKEQIQIHRRSTLGRTIAVALQIESLKCLEVIVLDQSYLPCRQPFRHSLDHILGVGCEDPSFGFAVHQSLGHELQAQSRCPEFRALVGAWHEVFEDVRDRLRQLRLLAGAICCADSGFGCGLAVVHTRAIGEDDAVVVAGLSRLFTLGQVAVAIVTSAAIQQEVFAIGALFDEVRYRPILGRGTEGELAIEHDSVGVVHVRSARKELESRW